jgi:Na+/H+-dicarboxylate symporter
MMKLQNIFSRSVPLSFKIIVGVIFGVLLGLIFKDQPYFGSSIGSFSNQHLGQLGMLVIKLLRAIAPFLVFFAIIDAFFRVNFSLKRGLHLLTICIVNVTVAMMIAGTIMNVFKPGFYWQGRLDSITKIIETENHTPVTTPKAQDPEAPETSLDPLKNFAYFIPSNLIKPFFYNNIISIVFLALLVGASMRTLVNRKSLNTIYLEHVVRGIYDTLIIMLEWIIKLVPFAVFAVMAQVVGAAGLEVFKFLWIYLVLILMGLFIHCFLYYPTLVYFIGRISPKRFFKVGGEAMVTGLSLNSSLATVPVTLKCLDKLNISEGSSRLGTLVGTNLNNDGITLYEAMTAIFITQALGYDLNFSQQLTIFLSAIFAGAGIAGIPEAGIIVLPLVLGAAGIPPELVATLIPLFLPVDWIIARVRSMVNVTSDMVVSIVLNRWETEK